jgi:hypothetical protein
MLKTVLRLLPLLAVAACVDPELRIEGCEPVGEMRPVCGMQSPEDIAALPDGQYLLLANFGGMKHGTGSLSLFDTRTERLTPLFPGPEFEPDRAAADWGEPGCEAPPPDAFSPHGTHLHRLRDGRLRYAVVNHGARESIELFEVLGQGAGSRLAWRGCMLAPPDTFINDVAGLANGDLIYTRMFHRNDLRENLMSFLGANTGDLWRWSREEGARLLPGTGANQPNGIEIAPDQRHVFANMYFTGEIWKVDVDTAEVVARAPVPAVDNSAWGSDGRLWLTAHRDSLPNLLSCFREQAKPCGAGFEIIALDPHSLAFETLFAHRGAPMGAATVAVPQAGRVWIGSFVGDRLVSIPDPVAQP